MSAATNINEVWLSRRQAAGLARLSVERFDAALRPLVADADVRREGRKLLLRGEAVVDAIVSHRAQNGDDPLMTVAVNSPALERYREARARIVEMDREERERSHVPIERLDAMLAQFSSHLRRGGETLLRRWGNDAAAVFNDALTSAGESAKAVIGNVN